MTRRRTAILILLLLLAAAAAGAWLLPPRIPAPPRWHAVDAGEVRLWFRDEEMTPGDEGGAELRLHSGHAALWIESAAELSSAVFLLRGGGSGLVSVRSWERWRPWGRTPPAAAPPPDDASRLFLEWQNPRLVHRREDGRLFYRMEIRQSEPGEATLVYLGPREAVERPLYDVAWDGCGAPDGVAAGETFLALARYRNRSPYPWPDRGNVRVRLGYRWLGAAAEDAARDLPGPVAPGEAQDAWIRVQGPSAPGRYVLELDLDYEPVAWFSEKGAQTCRVEVVVG